jgi:hypothetical protein
VFTVVVASLEVLSADSYGIFQALVLSIAVVVD